VKENGFKNSSTRRMVLMEIKKLDYDFSVCRIEDLSLIDFTDEFIFIGKTDEELSLVCLTRHVPANTIQREDGWKAFRIQGILDFSLVGVLSGISALLAEHHISIFAVSTYHTDYILTKDENFAKAIYVLKEAGYQVL